MPEDDKYSVGSSLRGGKKRRVSIAKKLEIIKKLEKGVSVHLIMAQYNLSKTTVYDIMRSRELILRLPRSARVSQEPPEADDEPHSFNGSNAEGIAPEDGFPMTMESPVFLPPSQNNEIPKQLHVQDSNHLRNIMETLALDEAFLDVTLTAEGRAIRAHKLVLSAMSPYFQQVLYSNPCRHPVIIMPHHVQFDHLTHIIEYIYKGEITVAEDQLKSLLRSAKLLQVNGLTISNSAILSNDNCLSAAASPSTSYTEVNCHPPEYTTVASPLSCSAGLTKPLDSNSKITIHQRGSHIGKASTGSSVGVSFPTVSTPAGPSQDTNLYFNMSDTSNACTSYHSGTTTFRGTTDVTNKVFREAVKMETDRALCTPCEIKANSTSAVSDGRNFPVHDGLAAEPVQAVLLGGAPVTGNTEYDMSDQNIYHPHELQEQPFGDPTFNSSLPDDKPVFFEEVEDGTKRRRRKLVRSDGFTYTVKRNNRSCTYWVCSVRNKKLRCPAHVKQYGDMFITSSHTHVHQACPKMVNNS